MSFLRCLRLSSTHHHPSALLTVTKSKMAPKKRPAAENGSSSSDGSAKKNKSNTDWESIKFESSAKTKNGDKWNFKISSWNVDGLRAWLNKGGLEFLDHENPDIICLQEIKCSEQKLPEDVKDLKDYPNQYWHPAEKEGYSGVALFSKEKPISVNFGLGDIKDAKDFNDEGRLITAEFEKFYVVTTYVPNAGAKLITLPKRMKWDPLFREHVANLDKEKPVIVCGDLNVAHKEIDLANPKTNKKSAGFTVEERGNFDVLLSKGLVDTFRHFYPDQEKAYTFWTYMMNARAKNVGWRLDYFLVSERIVDKNVCDNVIRNEVYGSDHCPLTLLLHF